VVLTKPILIKLIKLTSGRFTDHNISSTHLDFQKYNSYNSESFPRNHSDDICNPRNRTFYTLDDIYILDGDNVYIFSYIYNLCDHNIYTSSYIYNLYDHNIYTSSYIYSPYDYTF